MTDENAPQLDQPPPVAPAALWTCGTSVSGVHWTSCKSLAVRAVVPDPAGEALPAPTHGWTSHGHTCCINIHTTGLPDEPAEVAKCGGPGVCRDCTADAAAIHLPAGVVWIGRCFCGGVGDGLHRVWCPAGLDVTEPPTNPNAMIDPVGFVFYPDDATDAAHLKQSHRAVPLNPESWPFGELPTNPCYTVPCPPWSDDPRPITGAEFGATYATDWPEGCRCYLREVPDQGEVFTPPSDGSGCPVHTPSAFPGYSLADEMRSL